jgi:hypothetical protein
MEYQLASMVFAEVSDASGDGLATYFRQHCETSDVSGDLRGLYATFADAGGPVASSDAPVRTCRDNKNIPECDACCLNVQLLLCHVSQHPVVRSSRSAWHK